MPKKKAINLEMSEAEFKARLAAAHTHKTPGVVGGGIPEAPKDGRQYVRKDGMWIEVIAGECTCSNDGTGTEAPLYRNSPVINGIQVHCLSSGLTYMYSIIGAKAAKEISLTPNQMYALVSQTNFPELGGTIEKLFATDPLLTVVSNQIVLRNNTSADITINKDTILNMDLNVRFAT